MSVANWVSLASTLLATKFLPEMKRVSSGSGSSASFWPNCKAMALNAANLPWFAKTREGEFKLTKEKLTAKTLLLFLSPRGNRPYHKKPVFANQKSKEDVAALAILTKMNHFFLAIQFICCTSGKLTVMR